MTDKILTWIVIILVGIVATEFLIPGPTNKTVINSISLETGLTVNNTSVRNYQERAAYFDYYRIRISDSDATFFYTGDSIEYRVTPILKNLKSIKNIKNSYQIYVHTYLMLLLLTAVIIVFQILSVKITWNKRIKEFIHIFIFSFILTVGYLLIFK